MAELCFDCFLPDEAMRVQLKRGETFLFTISKWQEIERQIERLGFEDSYLVTQVSTNRGKMTKVTPVLKGQP